MNHHLKRNLYVKNLRFFLIFSLLICSFSMYAFHPDPIAMICEDGDWVLMHSENGIEIYSTTSQCRGNNFYFFKVKNLTGKDQQVEVNITVPDELTYGPMTFSALVPAGSESLANCESNHLRLPNNHAQNRKSIEAILIKLHLK